jgi:hypothetical protein
VSEGAHPHFSYQSHGCQAVACLQERMPSVYLLFVRGSWRIEARGVEVAVKSPLRMLVPRAVRLRNKEIDLHAPELGGDPVIAPPTPSKPPKKAGPPRFVYGNYKSYYGYRTEESTIAHPTAQTHLARQCWCPRRSAHAVSQEGMVSRQALPRYRLQHRCPLV